MPLTPAQANEEIKFWLYQDMEHNLFFSLGLEDPGLKVKAQKLYDDYQKDLFKNDLKTAFNDILPRSQVFKQELKATQAQKWVGWIYPDFVDHVDMEIRYFLARISPQESRPEMSFVLGTK
jgi:hypothetical protein